MRTQISLPNHISRFAHVISARISLAKANYIEVGKSWTLAGTIQAAVDFPGFSIERHILGKPRWLVTLKEVYSDFSWGNCKVM